MSVDESAWRPRVKCNPRWGKRVVHHRQWDRRRARIGQRTGRILRSEKRGSHITASRHLVWRQGYRWSRHSVNENWASGGDARDSAPDVQPAAAASCSPQRASATLTGQRRQERGTSPGPLAGPLAPNGLRSFRFPSLQGRIHRWPCLPRLPWLPRPAMPASYRLNTHQPLPLSPILPPLPADAQDIGLSRVVPCSDHTSFARDRCD
jgi:hypothetical protein